MNFETAQSIAIDIKALLEPYCDRIEIAGSIRRQKPEVKDIEIVCIPKKIMKYDMFNSPIGEVVHSGFASTVAQWEKIKGEPNGKYTQRRLTHQQGDINLDLFIATPENWGYQLAIRTGSADYSHQVLARTWKSLGFESSGGILYRDGGAFAIREEIDLFNMLNLPYIEPKHRS